MNATNFISSKNKTWIKICGFTDPDNASACARFALDAMGLVFFEKSPRNVSAQTARQITAVLPETILPIGVFVNKSYDEIMQIVEYCQLKGGPAAWQRIFDLAQKLMDKNLFVIKALFAKKAPFLDQAEEFKAVSSLLIEYGKGVLPGGNAESWDYEISCKIKTDLPVILAGGLDPDTITDALKKAHPAGVDVSSGVEKSGVETSFGIKDVRKVEQFIHQVRSFAR